MATERGVQNIISLCHIILGGATLIGSPVIAAGTLWAVSTVYDVTFSLMVILRILIPAVIAGMVAGSALILAGHFASKLVQQRWQRNTDISRFATRPSRILLFGWLLWMGFVYIALGVPIGRI